MPDSHMYNTKLAYLDENDVQDTRFDVTTPTYGRNVDGYGRKIPTGQWLKVKNRWRRIYVTQYSNAGTAWVIVDGSHLIVR